MIWCKQTRTLQRERERDRERERETERERERERYTMFHMVLTNTDAAYFHSDIIDVDTARKRQRFVLQ